MKRDPAFYGYAPALTPEPSYPETVFADEMAHWLSVSANRTAVHVLASAYATGQAMSTLAQAVAVQHWRQAPQWLHHVATDPSPQTLAAALTALGLPQADVFDAFQRFPALHPVSAPPSALLVADGDKRTALSPLTGLNRYGCAPHPQAGVIALSSCTGNEPTKIGLAAVQRLKYRLMQAAWNNRLETARTQVQAELTARIAAVMGVALKQTDQATLTTSGSAAAHLAAAHFCPEDQPSLYLLVGQKETGREVPDAISIGAHVTIEDMFIRHDETGQAVAADVLVSRLEQRISRALHQGMRVVLQVVEGSKTGLTSPGITGVERLVKRFPKGLSIVADFCQMKPGSQVKPYADLGAAIIATGSKFLGGPALAGIAIVPGGNAQPMPSIGTLARWEASLAESEGYCGLTKVQIETGLKRFSDIVCQACVQRPNITVVADHSLSHVMSIHVAVAQGGVMDMDKLKDVQSWLMVDASALLPLNATASDHALMSRRCLVGQPVMVGKRAGLRLAINAARLTSAVQDSDGDSRLSADVTALLGKIDLIRRFI